ncbi:MAG: hypothetical protein EBW47_06560, partial [Betaproteobacteria bacterium]|nr:hypothetical protein [Betaproteobacteria bacterium]
MRLKEFANAEEQLALWRVISDKVWGELKTLADQQMKAARAAAKQAAARPKRPTPAAAAPPPDRGPFFRLLLALILLISQFFLFEAWLFPIGILFLPPLLLPLLVNIKTDLSHGKLPT